MAARHEDLKSPVDLPGSQLIGGHPLRWTTGVIAIAALFLFLTNAKTIHDWADELEPGPWTEKLVEASGQWQDITDRLGLGATRAGAHELWKAGQRARFGHEKADDAEQ
jgi:hypothetical protein